MQEATTPPGPEGPDDDNLSVTITQDGMVLHRPSGCSDTEWQEIRDRMSDWWTAWQEGFMAGRRAEARTEVER